MTAVINIHIIWDTYFYSEESETKISNVQVLTYLSLLRSQTNV